MKPLFFFIFGIQMQVMSSKNPELTRGLTYVKTLPGSVLLYGQLIRLTNQTGILSITQTKKFEPNQPNKASTMHLMLFITDSM